MWLDVLRLYIIGQGVLILWNDIVVLTPYYAFMALTALTRLSTPVAVGRDYLIYLTRTSLSDYGLNATDSPERGKACNLKKCETNDLGTIARCSPRTTRTQAFGT